jgi:hypothetical protein
LKVIKARTNSKPCGGKNLGLLSAYNCWRGESSDRSSSVVPSQCCSHLYITLPSPDASQRPALIQNFRLDSCNEQEPRYPCQRTWDVLAPPGCTSYLAPRTSDDAQTTNISSVNPHYDHVPFCGAPYLIRRFSYLKPGPAHWVLQNSRLFPLHLGNNLPPQS